MGSVRKDLTGQVFGRLTVIEFAGLTKSGHALWRCGCQCGAERIVRGRDLRVGNTHSCGCIQRGESRIGSYIPSSIHDPEYPRTEAKILGLMRQRCCNPANSNFSRYGGRGILVKFDSVFDLIEAIGRRPTTRHTVDRIDNDGHYEAGNVRWATRAEQARNTRAVRYLTVNGVTKNLHDWASDVGLSRGAISTRIRNGWCSQCVVTLGPKQRCTHRGELSNEK